MTSDSEILREIEKEERRLESYKNTLKSKATTYDDVTYLDMIATLTGSLKTLGWIKEKLIYERT